jgi:hypothetical protein
MGSAGLPKAFTFGNPYSDQYQTTENLEIRKKPLGSSFAFLASYRIIHSEISAVSRS